MSRDSKSKASDSVVEPVVAPVDEQAVVKKPIITTADAVASESAPPVRVKRPSRKAGEEGPLAGLERFIPKGWTGRLVNPSKGRCEYLYENRGYEFAADDQGKKIYRTVNGTSSDTNKHILMMIRDEYVEEVQRERMAERKKRINQQAAADTKGIDKSGFFSDIGLTDDNI